MTETPSSPVAQPLSTSDANLWASLAHFGNILGFLPSLLILLILGPRSTRVRQEAREALNFVITATIAWVALAILGSVLFALYVASPSGIDVLFGLLRSLVSLAQLAVYVLVIVLSIVGGVRVNRGGSYRYPFALRLVR